MVCMLGSRAGACLCDTLFRGAREALWISGEPASAAAAAAAAATQPLRQPHLRNCRRPPAAAPAGRPGSVRLAEACHMVVLHRILRLRGDTDILWIRNSTRRPPGGAGCLLCSRQTDHHFAHGGAAQHVLYRIWDALQALENPAVVHPCLQLALQQGKGVGACGSGGGSGMRGAAPGAAPGKWGETGSTSSSSSAAAAAAAAQRCTRTHLLLQLKHLCLAAQHLSPVFGPHATVHSAPTRPLHRHAAPKQLRRGRQRPLGVVGCGASLAGSCRGLLAAAAAAAGGGVWVLWCAGGTGGQECKAHQQCVQAHAVWVHSRQHRMPQSRPLLSPAPTGNVAHNQHAPAWREAGAGRALHGAAHPLVTDVHAIWILCRQHGAHLLQQQQQPAARGGAV